MPTAMDKWLDTMGKDTRVVVLDSGFNDHGDVVISEARSFVRDRSTHDLMNHGSQVARIIAGRDPVALGVAPQCQLYIGKVMGGVRGGWGFINSALQWAIGLRAQVVNMSFACRAGNYDADRLLEELDRSGCICVASYNPSLPWPHTLPYVAAAGALDRGGAKDVLTLREAGRASGVAGHSLEGTSVSAALISGMAALAKAADPSINREVFLQQLAIRR